MRSARALAASFILIILRQTVGQQQSVAGTDYAGGERGARDARATNSPTGSYTI
jgi:hypothetical protein